jgi:hypothetical protein
MKYFFLGIALLFGSIAFVGWLKKPATKPPVKEVAMIKKVETIALGTTAEPIPVKPPPARPSATVEAPEVNRIDELFSLDQHLPIVETVSFTSRVPWLKDRPAWIADYASHYQTSRHFIARSLNKKNDYFTQKVHPGARFNVFRKDKNIRFSLLADLAKCKMYFYCLDQNEKILLKTYKIGAGKMSSSAPSGCLTPLGKYELGDRIAIYKPGVMGYFQDEKVEMIRVFGTRWIPLSKKLEGTGELTNGLGIHGLPWIEGPNGTLVEDRSKLGKLDSDGCIRLAQEDIEEIFAIVITKPTTLEIVKELK